MIRHTAVLIATQADESTTGTEDSNRSRNTDILLFVSVAPRRQKPSKLILYNYLKTEINLHFLPIILLRREFASIRPKSFWVLYKGADKSLARPARKQATAAEDFEFHVSYL
jgi:hypothetical protein